ncbi:class I SAM-dependent methyltransferase [Treponema sp. R80B11-R83G3]
MDLKTRTKEHFNNQAILYDLSNKYKYPRFHYNILLEEIKKQYPLNTFLDVGCGTGVIIENLNKNNLKVSCYGIDLSENMINQAKERLGNNVNLVLGDAENLPYENNMFDCICCSSSFHHYPNPQKALLEINRVLKDGGRFVLCDTNIIFPLRQIVNIIIPHLNRGDVHIYNKKEIKKLFCDVGFKNIEWKVIPHYAFICIGYK